MMIDIRIARRESCLPWRPKTIHKVAESVTAARTDQQVVLLGTGSSKVAEARDLEVQQAVQKGPHARRAMNDERKRTFSTLTRGD